MASFTGNREDVSGETQFFDSSGVAGAMLDIRRTISTSQCFEDVSGEGFIVSNQRRKPTPAASPFCEDVSGETLPITMLDIRRTISTSQFSEDVPGEIFMF